MTRPWPIDCVEMSFRIETESIFLEEKGIDSREGPDGAFLPGFLWPIILLCLVLSLYLVYFRVLPSAGACLGLRR